MVESNDFLLPGLEHVDAATSLVDLGAVELDEPTQDIDGDGTLDTVTAHTDESMIVATDTDHDGGADHITVVDGDGDYAQWEFTEGTDPQWQQVDHGKLGE